MTTKFSTLNFNAMRKPEPNQETDMGQKEIPEISVVVPISERHDDVKKLYRQFADQLRKMGKTFEFLFVIDGDFQVVYEDLKKMKNSGHPIRIVKFSKNFGESTALMEGFRQARADIILTLASYFQVEPEDLGKLFTAYEQGNDLVVTRRYPRKDPFINRLQSTVYHYLVRKLTGTSFKDITSGLRLINKNILPEFNLYGDLHRFIPIFADQRGIKVKEIDVTHRREDTRLRLVKPGVYLRRILDILTLFFLVKFTKKPLRFFGLIGSSVFLFGFLITFYLAILRFLALTSLSDRPLLLLGILLMVFGIQLFSIGLVGELILFSHAREIRDYSIEEIIE
jgi:glycosyltransferase involved in cell wall biosynthesis